MLKKKQRSDLIEVQRGVVAERTDGCQLNQGLVLSARHAFPVLVPEDARATLTPSSSELAALKEAFQQDAYTSPSGA